MAVWFQGLILGISIHPISKPRQHLISVCIAVLQEGRWKPVHKQIGRLLIYSQTGDWLMLGFYKKKILHLILVWKQLDLCVWMKFWWSHLNPGNVIIRYNRACLIPAVPRCDCLSFSYNVREANTLVGLFYATGMYMNLTSVQPFQTRVTFCVELICVWHIQTKSRVFISHPFAQQIVS